MNKFEFEFEVRGLNDVWCDTGQNLPFRRTPKVVHLKKMPE